MHRVYRLAESSKRQEQWKARAAKRGVRRPQRAAFFDWLDGITCASLLPIHLVGHERLKTRRIDWFALHCSWVCTRNSRRVLVSFSIYAMNGETVRWRPSRQPPVQGISVKTTIIRAALILLFGSALIAKAVAQIPAEDPPLLLGTFMNTLFVCRSGFGMKQKPRQNDEPHDGSGLKAGRPF